MAVWERERELQVAENLKLQSNLIESLRRETGVCVQSLSGLKTLRGAELDAAIRHLAPRVSVEGNVAFRYCFFLALASHPSNEYFDSICAWYREEDDPDCRQVLESLLIRLPASAAIRVLLIDPAKIQMNGLRFLIKQSRRNAELMSRLRHSFDSCQFDLEVLSVLGNQFEEEYNLLCGANSAGSVRLSGRHCSDVLLQQVPNSEYSFRRAEFVPYFARIVESWTIPPDDIQTVSPDLFLRYELTCVAPVVPRKGAPTAVLLALRSASTGALALISLPGTADVSEIGVARKRSGHRPRSVDSVEVPDLAKIVLAKAPPPDPANLLPKRLLPPDHPIRFAKPEV